MQPETSKALPHRYVLSLSRDSVCVEFATRLVADSGVAVVRVEPSAGDPLRGSAALFAYLTAGKQVRVLDLTTAGGKASLEALAGGAAAIAVDEWGRDLLAGPADRPGLVVIGERDSSVLRTVAGMPSIRETLAFHAGGLGFLTPRMMPGFPSAAPLCPDARLSTLMIGIYGAIALLTTTVGRLRGKGAASSSIGVVAALLPLLRREFASVNYDGTTPHRNERIWKVSPAEVHRCRDGWVFVDIIEEPQWVALCGYMGQPALAEHPLYATLDLRFDNAEALCVILDAFFATMAKDCWIEAQARGIPIAPVNAPDDLLVDEQLLARGFWQHGNGPARRVPHSPLRGFGPDQGGKGTERDDGQKPLAGLRVIELTHVWSGPLCGQVLADMGAEVIRVENAGRLDIHRRSGPFAGGQVGINRSGTWNAQNRGKRACTLDLKAPEGRAALLALVAESDVLIENFTPGTIDRLGLGLAELRRANGRLVLLSLSGFGQNGPHSQAMAYGPMMDAATGISALTTYADGVPRAVNGWAADVGGALYGCAAVLRALLEGPAEAVHLDVSQFESGVLFALEALLAAAAGEGRAAGHEIVARCVEVEAWIAVSAQSANEITALGSLVGCPGDAAAGLAERVQVWAGGRPRLEALAALRTAGVPAVAVQTVPELMADAGLAERGAWIETIHAEVGPIRTYAPPIRLAGQPAELRPAPCLGQDNDYVFGTLLGLPEATIQDFKERRII